MPAIENLAMHTIMHIMTTVIEIVIPRFTMMFSSLNIRVKAQEWYIEKVTIPALRRPYPRITFGVQRKLVGLLEMRVIQAAA
jgi:hypothetical protein